MTDRDFELLSAAFDHEATPDELVRVEQLLATSAEARQHWDELRQLSDSLHELPRETLPVEFPSQVLRLAEQRSLLGGAEGHPTQAVQASKNQTGAAGRGRPGVRFWPLSIVAMLATAAALFALVSIWFGPREQQRSNVVLDQPRAKQFARDDAVRARGATPAEPAAATNPIATNSVGRESAIDSPPAQQPMLEERTARPQSAAGRAPDVAGKSVPAPAAAAPGNAGEAQLEAGVFEVYVVDVADGMTLEVLRTTLSPVRGLRKSARPADQTEPTTEGLFVTANDEAINDALQKVRDLIGHELESHLVAMNELPEPMQKLLHEQSEPANGLPAAETPQPTAKDASADAKPAAKYPAKPQVADKSKSEAARLQANLAAKKAATEKEAGSQKKADADRPNDSKQDFKKTVAGRSRDQQRAVVELDLPQQYIATLEKDQAKRQAGQPQDRKANRRAEDEKSRQLAERKEGAKGADPKPTDPSPARRILIVVRRTMKSAVPQPPKIKGGA